jgi:hypothetical protein
MVTLSIMFMFAICGAAAVVPYGNSGIGDGEINTFWRALPFFGGVVLLLVVAIPTFWVSKYYWPETHRNFASFARPFIDHLDINDPNPAGPESIARVAGAVLNVIGYVVSAGLGFVVAVRCLIESGERQQAANN